MQTPIIAFLSSGVEIALTVFVILTVFLGAFIAVIFASKRFRDMLFSSDKKQKKTARKAPAKSAKSSRQTKKPSQKQPQKQTYLVYNDTVPTVPLMGGIVEEPDETNIMRRTNDALLEITLGTRSKSSPKTSEPPTIAITTPPAANKTATSTKTASTRVTPKRTATAEAAATKTAPAANKTATSNKASTRTTKASEKPAATGTRATRVTKK